MQSLKALNWISLNLASLEEIRLKNNEAHIPIFERTKN